MSVRIETVTQENLQDLPDFRLHPFSCKYCVYWESTGNLDERIEKSKAEKVKRDWFKNTSNAFGDCGLLLYQDDIAAGYAQFAPAKFFRRLKEYLANPSLGSSVFLACLYLPRRDLRGRGLGKLLLDRVTKNLKDGNYAVLQTLAKKGEKASVFGPEAFYLKQGFKVEFQQIKYSLLMKELQ